MNKCVETTLRSIMASSVNVVYTFLAWDIKILFENNLTADRYRQSTMPEVALIDASFKYVVLSLKPYAISDLSY